MNTDRIDSGQEEQAAPEKRKTIHSRKRLRLIIGVLGAVFIGLVLLLLFLPDPGVGTPGPPGPLAQEAAEKAKGLTREQVLSTVDESALQVWWRHEKNGEQHEERIYRFPDGMVTISINLLHNKVVDAKAVGMRPGGPAPAGR